MFLNKPQTMDAIFSKLTANIADIAKEYAKECLKIWIPAFIEASGVDVNEDELSELLLEKMPEFKFPIISDTGKVKKPRAPSAYTAFQREKRAELKKDDLSEEEIRKRISEEWKEADKEEWNEKAGVEKKVKKRGISGYNLFCREERANVKSAGFEDNKDIMKELGRRWSDDLTDAKKAKWNEAAKLENEKNGFSSGSSESGESKSKGGKAKKTESGESKNKAKKTKKVEVEEDEDEPVIAKGKKVEESVVKKGKKFTKKGKKDVESEQEMSDDE